MVSSWSFANPQKKANIIENFLSFRLGFEGCRLGAGSPFTLCMTFFRPQQLIFKQFNGIT